ESAADVQATLMELSAVTIADALHRQQPGTARLIACGGGVRNTRLIQRIAARLPGVIVESSAAHGLDPDYVEAMAFAWLARETLVGRPGNLPAVTGARGGRVPGVVQPACAPARRRAMSVASRPPCRRRPCSEGLAGGQQLQRGDRIGQRADLHVLETTAHL